MNRSLELRDSPVDEVIPDMGPAVAEFRVSPRSRAN